MRADELKQFLTRRPFEPIPLHVSGWRARRNTSSGDGDCSEVTRRGRRGRKRRRGGSYRALQYASRGEDRTAELRDAAGVEQFGAEAVTPVPLR